MKVEVVKDKFKLIKGENYEIRPGMYRIWMMIEKGNDGLIECYTNGIGTRNGVIVHYIEKDGEKEIHRKMPLSKDDTCEFYRLVEEIGYKKGNIVAKRRKNSSDYSHVRKGIVVSDAYRSSHDGALHCNVRFGEKFIDLPQFCFDKIDEKMPLEYAEITMPSLDNPLFYQNQKLLNKYGNIVRFQGFRHKRKDGMIYVYVCEGKRGCNRYYIREDELHKIE